MILGITGSRRIYGMNKYPGAMVYYRLSGIIKENNIDIGSITEVITGGAGGGDAVGELWAIKHRIPRRSILPDYNTYPSDIAPLMRNIEIVSLIDILIALWDGRSGGTWHTIEMAKILEKPYYIELIR
jgi:hypothetical protein